MKEPISQTQRVADNMGYADWPTQHRYPRYQIRTVKQLLEDPNPPFDIPESYRIPRQTGVGRLQRDVQPLLEF